MTVPVSNTLPLTNLAAIGQFDLLRDLYGGLLVAEAVWEELNAGGRAWPGRAEVATADWIERRAVQNRPLVTALRERLDPGEAETIALAVACQPPLVRMDEKEGRRAALRVEDGGRGGRLDRSESVRPGRSGRAAVGAIAPGRGFFPQRPGDS